MLVIFDCDGVLVDSEIIAARVDAEILSEAGYPITAEEVAHRFAGLTTERIFEIAGEELGRGIPDALVRRAEEETDSRLEREAVPVRGADAMLDRLDWPRCICSNSRPERLRMTLEVAGLYDRFRPYVFSAREVGDGRGKPAPDVFLHAAAVLVTDPADAIVVEDSVSGIAGAVAAGMRVIGFVGASHSWPGHSEALMDAGALTVVRRLSELPATVEALREWSPDLV